MTPPTNQATRGRLSPLLKQATKVRPVRGEGVYLFDADDHRYLDFTAGIGVTSTGHCHPHVVQAAQEQVGRLIHGQYTTVMHERLEELTDRLAARMPGDIDTLFYVSAGTEAVEAAVRLARQATGRTNIIAFQGGFHGRTTGSLSLTTSRADVRAGLQPLMSGVFFAPFPHTHHFGWDEKTTNAYCIRELKHMLVTQTLPEETAAVLIEPILGEGGFVPANTAFMQSLRELCDEHGLLLIVDEVQAGFARTGRFWSHEHFDVQPDIVITAKGLASGFPLSAFAASHDLMSKAWPGSQGGTYGGNAVACAAAIATLDVIERENLVDNAHQRGEQLQQRLRDLQKRHDFIADVRGKGLMTAAEIDDPDRAARITAKAEAERLLLLKCGPNKEVIRFLPPLIVTADQMDEAVDIFERACKAA